MHPALRRRASYFPKTLIRPYGQTKAIDQKSNFYSTRALTTNWLDLKMNSTKQSGRITCSLSVPSLLNLFLIFATSCPKSRLVIPALAETLKLDLDTQGTNNTRSLYPESPSVKGFISPRATFGQSTGTRGCCLCRSEIGIPITGHSPANFYYPVSTLLSLPEWLLPPPPHIVGTTFPSFSRRGWGLFGAKRPEGLDPE